MTKKEIDFLEKCFEAEMASAMGSRVSALVQSKPNNTVNVLVAKGMIHCAEEVLPGRFPMKIVGYLLTPLDHLTYCEQCKDEGD